MSNNICPICKGKGEWFNTRTGVHKCPDCHGTGYVNPIETTAEATSPTCPTCGAIGPDFGIPECTDPFHGGTGTVQPPKPKVQIKKFEQCLDAQCSTCHPTPDTNWNKEAPNSNISSNIGISPDYTETYGGSVPMADEETTKMIYTDRQLINKWLGGQSSDIIDRIDDMELLLEIIKICERRRG